jgi:hypothetical protein
VDIAPNVLSSSLTEIDADGLEVPAGADVDVEVGVEVGVDVGVEVPAAGELVLLPHAATSSAAVAAATAVSPALADTEYNGVPRLFSRDMTWHVRKRNLWRPGQ